MDPAGHAQSELWLFIVDAVAPHDLNSSLGADRGSSLQDARAHRGTQLGHGQAQDGQCADWLPAHRVHIREAVRRSNAAKIKRVIHNRHEEIHRLDHRKVVRQAHNGPVVARLKAHQNVRIRVARKHADDAFQVLRTQLAPSTTAVAELRQTNVHPVLLLAKQTK